MKYISFILFLLLPIIALGSELETKVNGVSCTKSENIPDALDFCNINITVNVAEKFNSVMCYGQVIMKPGGEYGFLQRNHGREGLAYEPVPNMEFIATVHFQEAWKIQSIKLLWVKCETFNLPKENL